MRRSLFGLTVASILAVLVTVSIAVNFGINRAGNQAILRTLDDMLRSDFLLQRDVLLLHAGLLGNYDPLVLEISHLTASLERLLKMLPQKASFDSLTCALSASIQKQDRLIERLKREQAIAYSSLAYLSLLGEQVTAADNSIALPVQALIEAALRLDNENTPSAVRQLRVQIDAVSALVASGDHGMVLPNLLAHARLLEDALPQVDTLLRAVMATDLPTRAAAVRREAEARRAAQQAKMRLYGTVVNAVLLLLLFVLAIRFLLTLKYRRDERAERAAAERIVTLTSTLFVACGPEQTRNVLDLALAMLGRQTEFERICIVLLNPERLHVWDDRRDTQSMELRGRLLSAAAAAPGETFELVDGGRLGGFRLYDDERSIGIMTFEMERRQDRWPTSGVTIYRSIVPIIERALRQEALAIEREAQQPRLRQAQRLATAGELASGLAHNLNNIIGAVLGHAEMISECLARATSPSRYIDEIRQAAERGAELVETMLNFSRRDLSRDEVAISELMAETLSLLRVTLPVRVSLSTRDDAAGALVIGRAAELQQVMLNLVRNASQAIEGAGRITLSLTTAEVTAPRQLPFGAISSGAYVVLSVGDTGCGMDDHVLSHIFEPFFTTRPAGTGLGLATVADIVRDHDGAIEVRSTRGEGSLFTAWLPQAVGARTQTERGGQGEIVLFVEPVRDRRLQIEEILAALSYEPAGFERWEEAMTVLARAPLDYDAWLLYPSASDEMIDFGTILRIWSTHPTMPIALIGVADRLNQLRTTLPHQNLVIEQRSGAVGLAAGLRNLLHDHARSGAVRHRKLTTDSARSQPSLG